MRVGLSAGAFRTTVRFDDTRVRLQQLALVVTADLPLAPRWTAQLGAGANVDGRISPPGTTANLHGGGLASVALAFAAREQAGAAPFVLLGGSLSAAGTHARDSSLYAVDLRASVASGYTVGRRFTPYAAARLFGGPVFWRGDVGGDVHHYQLGAGLGVALPGGLDLALEVAPLGEQRAVSGVGATF